VVFPDIYLKSRKDSDRFVGKFINLRTYYEIQKKYTKTVDFSLQKGYIESSNDLFRNIWDSLFGGENDSPIYKMGQIRESTRDFTEKK